MTKFILGMLAMLTILVAIFCVVAPALSMYLFLTIVMGVHV